MCPHNCHGQTEHHPLCEWHKDWTPAGSRMQAVPRRETETKCQG